MKLLALVFLVLAIAGLCTGKLFVSCASVGMLFMIRHASKVFAKQDEPSPLRPEFVCSTITALGRKETESSQSFH